MDLCFSVYFFMSQICWDFHLCMVSYSSRRENLALLKLSVDAFSAELVHIVSSLQKLAIDYISRGVHSACRFIKRRTSLLVAAACCEPQLDGNTAFHILDQFFMPRDPLPSLKTAAARERYLRVQEKQQYIAEKLNTSFRKSAFAALRSNIFDMTSS